MRRFSQRSGLVTLSEINITPLLDLAFVLLIIFVITTPLLEQGMTLKLPKGGQADKAPKREDVRIVELDAQGTLMLEKKPYTPDQLEQRLVNDFRVNTNIVVYLRADRKCSWEKVADVMNRCQKHNILRFVPRFQPEKRP